MNDTLTPEDFLKSLKRLDRKSAIIARGIVEHFNSGLDDCTKLRNCQEEAIAYAKEVGVAVTGTSLTSKIGRHLRDAGVFQQFAGKPARGVGYVLEAGPNLEDFTEFLQKTPTYGILTKTEVDHTQIRVDILSELDDNGAVMLDADEHRVSSKVYGQLREMLNSGKLNVIYVRPSTRVAVKAKGDAKFHEVDFWVGDDE
jgi:hypothetical protein